MNKYLMKLGAFSAACHHLAIVGAELCAETENAEECPEAAAAFEECRRVLGFLAKADGMRELFEAALAKDGA